MNTRSITTFAVIAAVASGGVMFAAMASQDPPKPATHVVARGSLDLTVNREGRIESGVRHRVNVDAEAYGGSLDVTDVLVRGGAVKKGDVLLKFDPTKIDREIEGATTALANAQRAASFAETETRILTEGNAVRIERANAAKTAAEHAFEVFDKYQGHQMIRGAELNVQQQEYGLADQKEELAQLEKMYEGSSLASETKEIVIQRSRRQIAVSEEYLQFARENLIVTRDFTYPDRKAQVERDLKFASIELEHTLLQVQMGEANRRAQNESATTALRDAKERSEKLARDRARFDLAAPESGVMTSLTLVPGDSVGGQQVLAEIVDANQLTATFTATPEDLRVLAPGRKVSVTFPAYPEATVEGEVKDIAAVGTPAGGGTSFPVTVVVKGRHPLVRVGLNCNVVAESKVDNALLVPVGAIQTKNGKTLCHVWRNGASEARPVTIGAKTDKWAQVLDGLKAGDEVLAEAPKE